VPTVSKHRTTTITLTFCENVQQTTQLFICQQKYVSDKVLNCVAMNATAGVPGADLRKKLTRDADFPMHPIGIHARPGLYGRDCGLQTFVCIHSTRLMVWYACGFSLHVILAQLK